MVVLHEIRADAELGEGFLVPRFEEKTTRIAENTRPKQERPVDLCGIASHGKMRNGKGKLVWLGGRLILLAKPFGAAFREPLMECLDFINPLNFFTKSRNVRRPSIKRSKSWLPSGVPHRQSASGFFIVQAPVRIHRQAANDQVSHLGRVQRGDYGLHTS